LKPSRTERISGCVSEKTSATENKKATMRKTYGVTITFMEGQQKDQPWVEEGPKTLLKLNVFFPSFPCLDGTMSEILPSSMLLTGH